MLSVKAETRALISAEQLLSSKRILYMSHLAIGDFMYQGVFLQALQQTYPHLTIDVWFDDCRSKPKAWAKDRNKTLTQWLTQEDYIDTVYPIATSQKEREQTINRAQQQSYDLVCFIATTRSEQFAKFARLIAPNAFIAGTNACKWTKAISSWHYFRKINQTLNTDIIPENSNRHISDIYQYYFTHLLAFPAPKYSKSKTIALNISEELEQTTQLLLEKVAQQNNVQNAKYIFLNHLSTTEKRNYPWDKLTEVIQQLKIKITNCVFVINLPPSEINTYQKKISELTGIPILLFSATDGFFQLPAMIKACDWVITVETAIMHLAASLEQKQLVLMRKKATQWQPQIAEEILLSDGDVSNIEVNNIVTSTCNAINKYHSK